MQNWDQKASNYLQNHRQKKWYTFVALLLAAVVAFTVCSSLIMPAISATDENEVTDSSNALRATSTDSYFTEVVSSEPSGAYNFSSDVTSLTMTNVTIEDGVQYANFTIAYTDITKNNVNSTQAYIYIKLPEDIIVETDYYGVDCKIYDSSDVWLSQESSGLTGYYSIDMETGLLVMMFTSAYLSYIENQSSLSGQISFNGYVNRGDTVDGDVTVSIGSAELTIKFDDEPVTLFKTAVASDDTDATPTVTWTVTIENPGPYTDLKDSTLQDDMLKGVDTLSITATKDGETKTYSTSDLGTFESSTGTFTFNESASEYDDITFTYTTTASTAELESGMSENKATLTVKDNSYTDGNNTITDGAEVTWQSTNVKIEKSGIPSYEIEGEYGETGYILWTVNLSRLYGYSLNGYTLADSMLDDATIVSVQDSDGNNVNYTTGSGSLTIGRDTDNVIITYKTTASGDNDYTNNASVTPPNENEGDTGTSTSEKVEYDDTSLVTVDKAGNGYTESSIKWKITLDATNNANYQGDLDGYVISDSSLTEDVLANATIYAYNNGSSVSTSNLLKSNSDGTFIVNGTVDKVIIEYEVDLTDTQISSRLDGELTITNEVEVTDPDGETDEDEDSQTLSKLTNAIIKTLNSSNVTTEGKFNYNSPFANGETETQTLSWTVEIDKYDGFSGSSKVYVDVLSATGSSTHYITSDTANIVVYAKTATGSYSVLSTDNYTIKYYKGEDEVTDGSEATSFQIVFNSSVDEANYIHVKITYNTTADTSTVTNGSSASFSNTASFDSVSADGGSFTFERTMPEVPTISVTANKSWVNANTSQYTNVMLLLQYKKGTDGEWTTYTADGVTNPMTVLVSDTMMQIWGNLPQYTADDDQTPYYYRVVELDSNSNAVEDGGTNGEFVVNYDSNYTSGINSTGTLTVTNTWTKMNLEVNKLWYGDSAENRPTSIIVKLQYRIEGSDEWTDVDGSSQTMTKQNDGSFSSASWTRLDRFDENGYAIYYRAVESEAVAYYNESDDSTGINTSGTSTITNTYTLMSLTVDKQWSGDDGYESSRPSSITFKLQYKIGSNGEWTDVDTSYLSGYSDITVSKGSDNEYDMSLATWENLPKFDESENKIYYRAVETTTDSSYTATYNDTGIHSSGSFTITNVYNYISITAQKVWQDSKGSTISAPTSVSLQYTLKYRVGTSGEWETAMSVSAETNGNTAEVTVSYDSTTLSYPSVTWYHLPKTNDNGDTIYYTVEETAIDGYTSSSSASENGLNDSGTITITNKEKSVYAKYAVPIKAFEYRNTGTGWGEITDTGVDYSSGAVTNAVTSIESDDLITVTVDNVECYLIKWCVVINETEDGVYFVDYLPEGSSLYVNSPDYGIVLKYSGNEPCEVSTWTDASAYFQYDSSTNTIIFNKNSSIEYFIYFTAVTKSTVDAALKAYGTYSLTNTIIKSDDSNGQEATLTIGVEEGVVEEGVLNKSYNDQEINGYTGKAQYSLIVNPTGMQLSLDDTITITDIFEITGYQPSGGDLVAGSDLIDAILSTLKVEELDSGNDVIRTLSASEYSYLMNTKVVEKSEITDCTVNFYSYYQGYYYSCGDNIWDSMTLFYAGEVIIVEVEGIVGASVSPAKMGSSTEKFNIIALDTVYDSEGKARIQIEILTDFTGQIGINTANTTSTNITKESATLTTVTEVTQTVLTITVPNEMALQISYSYNLVTNSNTMEIDKSITEIGVRSPEGSTIYMTNVVSMSTHGGDDDYDEVDEFGLMIKNSNAFVYTSENSKIKKVDVGNYSISELTATFKLAKWDAVNSKWVYATSFEYDDMNQIYTIVYGDNGSDAVESTKTETVEGVETTYTYMPSSAADLEVTTSYNIQFADNTLYKLVEISAPSGYIQPTFVSTDETSLESLKDFTYHFIYNNDTEGTYSLPSDVDTDDIMTIMEHGSVTIPNYNQIDVSATKSWTTDPGDENASVTVTLYYSKNKSFSLPSDAVIVSSSTLEDLPDDFSSTATLSSSNDWTATWEDLPNGLDGVPIYYYVVETSYSIEGETTNVNTDGTSEGDYVPNYANEGLNQSGTVTITNSKGLIIEKVWKNSDKTIKTSGIPVDSITYNLYGVDSSGNQTLIYTGTLMKSNDWQETLTEVQLNNTNTTYVSYKVEEVLSSDDQIALYGYVTSYISSLNGSNGIMQIINTDNTPISVNVTVNKEWGDGADEHTSDSITATLYQSVGTLTTAQIENLGTESQDSSAVKYEAEGVDTTVTLDAANSWTYTWEDLPYSNDDTQRYYYYAVENSSVEGYEVSYSKVDKAATQTINIKNNLLKSLKVTKNWENQDGETITAGTDAVEVDVYRKSLSTMTTTTTSDGTTTTTTTSSSSKTIKVMPLGDSITNGFSSDNGNGYRPYLSYALSQTYGYNVCLVGSGSWSSSSTIYTFDDNGSQTSSFSYFYTDGSVSTVGWTIDNLVTALSEGGNNANAISTQNPDVIVLMIGTNDIMNASRTGGSVLSVDEYTSRYKTLLDLIYTQQINAQVLIMSPTPIIGGTGTVGNWMDQSLLDQNMANAISAIKSLVDTYTTDGKTLKYIDMNSYFLSFTDYTALLSDYCHPNEYGYSVMGTYLAAQVNAFLTGTEVDDSSSSSTTEDTTIDGLPSDFYSEDNTVNTDVYEYVKTVTLTESGSWSQTLTGLDSDYAYYVVEKTSLGGWTVTYNDNGQVPKDDVTNEMIITNTQQTTSINIAKTWSDSSDHSGDTVTMNVYRSTDPNDVPKQVQILTLSNNSTTVMVNYTATITGSNILTEATSANTSIATVAIENGAVVITGVTKGETTVTVSDGSSTKTIQVTVTTKPTFQLSGTSGTIEAGSSTNLTATLSDGSTPMITSVQSNNTSVATVTYSGNTITVMGTGRGNATITVTDSEGNTATYTVTVNYPSTFTLSGSDSITVGSTATLTPSPSYGKFTYSSSDTGVATVDGNGVVTGIAVGSATITATRDDGVTAEIEITVNEKAAGETVTGSNETLADMGSFIIVDLDSSKSVESLSITFDTSSTSSETDLHIYFGVWSVYFDIIYSNGSLSIDKPSGVSDYTIDGNTVTLTFSNLYEGSVTFYNNSYNNLSIVISSYTITYASSNTLLTSYSFRSVATSGSGSSAYYYTSVTLDAKGDWNATLSNLPVYDADGNTYYYWVEEASLSGYTAAYSYNDGENTTFINAATASINNTGTIQIENTRVEDSTTTMPETGGRGTVWYTLFVGAVFTIALAGLHVKHGGESVHD
ncbi:MAG: Cna B-type domain-containing protein [Ruminococcus sp.]|nr:Cna B-type domain-containing protein [Ruminococcus sp.]